MDDGDLEATAYHEAGHAVMTVRLGGEVVSVTVDPDRDDGPRRTGDLTTRWRRAAPDRAAAVERDVLVALAGPVAEMHYTGEAFHPATVAAWSADWATADAVAAAEFPARAKRTAYLERVTRELYAVFGQERLWQAVAGVADELLAHETLEDDEVRAVVEVWLRA
ncbi:MAG: hypothetical protein AAGJ97_10405 [Planctomycetota bacterium]